MNSKRLYRQESLKYQRVADSAKGAKLNHTWQGELMSHLQVANEAEE